MLITKSNSPQNILLQKEMPANANTAFDAGKIESNDCDAVLISNNNNIGKVIIT